MNDRQFTQFAQAVFDNLIEFVTVPFSPVRTQPPEEQHPLADARQSASASAPK